jgi:ribonuclease-3
MTHSSWSNERGEIGTPGQDNERLEYLGDAVLELVAGEHLFTRFPDYDEGRLTQLRAALVNTVSLARLAEKLDLGSALLVGKGAEKTGARNLPSLLANAFEAMIGAVFLDAGYDAAARVFLENTGDTAALADENYKGRLQEASQERFHEPPVYKVSAVVGPGHRREYKALAVVAGRTVAEGLGGTKQAAEQAAAQAALSKVDKMSPVRGDTGKRTGRRRPGPATKAAPARDAGGPGILAGLRLLAKTVFGAGEPEPPPPAKKRRNTRRGRR